MWRVEAPGTRRGSVVAFGHSRGRAGGGGRRSGDEHGATPPPALPETSLVEGGRERAMSVLSAALGAWSVWMFVVVLLFIVQDLTGPFASRP